MIKMRKIVAVLLACAAFLCAVPCTMAESDAYLEKVILAVKSKVEIPRELSEFTSEIYTDKETGRKSYQLSWYVPDADEKYGDSESANELIGIGVSADSDGVISYISFERVNIYRYMYESRDKLSPITKSEAQKLAEEMLEAYSPEYKDNMKIIATQLDGAECNVQFGYEANGLGVESDGAQLCFVIINKEAYPVTYSVNVGEDRSFAPVENAMGIEKVNALIRENNPYKINYHNGRYISRNNYELLLQYSLEGGNDSIYYDAVTGEVIEADYGIRYSQSTNAMKEETLMDMAASVGGGLSEQEIAEIEAIEGLLSAEEITEYLRETDELDIPDEYVLSSSRVVKKDDEYFTDITLSKKTEEDYYETVHATVNAQTKEIVAFSGPITDVVADAEKKQPDDAETEKLALIADNFVKKYMGNKFDNVSRDDVKPAGYGNFASSVNVTYTRVIDGIEYINNSVSIRLDRETGKVNSVYTNWTKPQNIPSAQNVISSSDVAEKVINEIGLHLCYIRVDGKPTLAYTLNKTGVNFDAVTGEAVKYNGDAIEEVFGGYTDIEGHWAENIIMALCENNIYMNTDKFCPDENMTQIEFLRYAASVDGYTDVNDDDLYEMLIADGVLPAEEKDAQKLITRAEAVTYLMRMCGYGNIGDIKGVFVCGFADEEAIGEKYYGYVAIAKGLGVVKGDGENYFKPNWALSRAAASSMIYNMMVAE